MRKLTKILTLLALSALLFTSCSQPSQQTNSSSSNQAETKQDQNNANASITVNPSAKNLCDLLPMAEVSKIAGVTFTKTGHKIDNSQNPYITDCFYSNDDAESVGIIANYDNGVNTAKNQYQQVVDYQAKQEKEFPSQKISGLGEAAFMPQMGMITQINALNNNVWITISVYLGKDKTAQKNATISIAQKALSVL